MSIESNGVPTRRMGRPRGEGPISRHFTVCQSEAYRVWVGEFLAFLGERKASDLHRDAIRTYAASRGFKAPPPI